MPGKAEAILGGSKRFECQVIGNPRPSIRWFKDGVDITNRQRYNFKYDENGIISMHIERVIPKDAGFYRCRAENSQGVASTAAYLQVKYGHEIGDRVSETHIMDAMEAEAIYDTQKKTYEESYQSRLEQEKYESIRVEKRGSEMKASEQDVTDSLKRKPAVDGRKSAPVITSISEDVYCKLGSKVYMDCSVAGFPTPEIKWLKDNKEIKADNRLIIKQAADKNSLEINQADGDDSGRYTLTARNSEGTVSGIVNVRVESPGQPSSPPVFLTKPVSQAVKEPKSTDFFCTVSGVPKPDVTWYKDGKKLTSDNHMKITEEYGNNFLDFTRTDAQDSGKYTCIARNHTGSVSSDFELKVTDDNIFSKKLTSVSVGENETATFTCETTQENLRVTWMKNGQKIYEDSRTEIIRNKKVHKLIIHNVRYEDRAEYSCVFENYSTKASLTVTEKRVFTQTMKEVRIEEGQTAEFVCETCDENTKVIWTKNGKEIRSDARTEIITDKRIHRLIVHKVTKEDLGEYRCYVGESYTKSNLIIEDELTFTQKLCEVRVTETNTAIFTCEMSRENVKVTWLKDGKELIADSRMEFKSDKRLHTLTIRDVTLADQGDYTCIAGTVSTTAAKLTEATETKPQFVKKLTDVKVNEKETATFSCEMSHENLKPIWMKGGEKLISDKKYEMVTDKKTQKLIIRDVTVKDKGEYTCIFGEVSTWAKLVVQEMKSDFTKKLTEQSVTETETATFTCELSIENLKPIWMKGGQKLTASEKYEIITDKKVQKLIIHNVTVQDKGEYTCILGETSTWAKLNVQELKFTKKLTELKVKIKETATFTCEMSKENMKAIWMKGGQKLTASNKYEMITDKKTQKLIIHDVTTQDKGEYTCISGSVSTWAKMVVEDAKAVFSQKLKEEIKVEPNGTATLICEMAEESTTATWLKDGAVLKADNRIEMISEKRTQKLIIHKVTSSDSGEYTCKVGNVSTTARLIVEAKKPEFTKKLTDQNIIEKGTATFVCEMSQENLKPIWMKGGQKLTADKKYEIITNKKIHKLIIHDVTMQDKAEYSCIFGETSTWAKLIVQAFVPHFTKKLCEIKAKENESVTFVCEYWEENARPIWMKGGQQLRLTKDKKYLMLTDKKVHKLVIRDVTEEDIGEYTCIYRDASTWAKLIVGELKPEFTRELSEIRAKDYETVTFICELNDDNLKPVWKKGEQQLRLTADKKYQMLTDKKVQKLIIRDVTEEDSGEYSCNYRNVSTMAKLVVGEVKVEFSKKLNDLKIKEKETVTFVCELSEENVKPIWMKGGQQLKADKKHEMITEKKSQKLIIHDVTAEDKGEYTCVYRDTSTWAKLVVEVSKVKFTKKLSEISVEEKGTASFMCEMSQEDLTPIWMKGGQKLSTSEKYQIITDKKVQKLIIHDVTMQDKAEYTCIYGETSTWAKLIVEAFKVQFIKKLSEVSVQEKGTAIFVCEMSKENLKPIWMKGGQKLSENQKYQMVTEKKVQKLIIHDVTIQDKAEYTCIYGETSTWAKLVVEAFKPQFTQKLNDVKAKEKDTVTFVCEMSQEDLTPIWMKGGQKLCASQKYQFVTDKKVQKLIIHDVTIQDKAEYTCIYGETSTWAKLVVEEEERKVKAVPEPKVKPEFTKKLTELKVKEKETATFVCEMSQENLKPIWMKGGQKLTADKKYEIITDKKVQKLIIHNVTVQDKGEYSCILGETSAWAKLNVQEFKPEFIKKLGQLRVQEKDTATFVCEMSYENLTPIWMKGGQKLTANKKYEIITDKTVQKLIIHDVSFEDKAEYTCIFGETSTWAKLIVEAFVPHFTKKLCEIRAKENESVTFVCEYWEENARPIWMKGGQQLRLTKDKKYLMLTDKKVHKLVIRDVTEEDSGEYTCIYREASTWAKLTVGELKPEFTRELSEIRAKDYETVTFICELNDDNLKPVWKKGEQQLRLTADKKYQMLTDKNVQKLIIRDVTEEDSGEYSCNYRNVSTMAKLVVGETKVEVKAEPVPVKAEFTKKLTELKVKEKETATFVCEMSQENLKPIWMKGGQKLTADKKYEIITDKKVQKLIIHNVTVQDKGEYSCILGETSTWAKLNVQEFKAEFIHKLSEITAKEKDTVTFVCEMSQENLTSIWMKGGQKLTTDNKYEIVTDKKVQKLIIRDVTVEDKGEYTCIYRDTSTWAKLVVGEIKTEFTKKLSEIKVKEKETATFVCEMSEENLKAIWMKGGQKLTADKKYEMVTDKKIQKLIIHDITVKDKGEYTCIYRDTSTWAKLNVEEIKAEFSKKLSEMKAKVKETATFVCEMSEENVKPIWMKGGQKLTADKKYQMVTDKKTQKLIISDITVEDKGEYTCIYRDTSTWAKLVVEETKAEFTQKLTEMKVKVKETATFTCELSAENIKPVWLKNGKELTSSKRIEMISEKKTHKLVIHEVTVEDKGEYTCVVGSVSTTAKLVVEDWSAVTESQTERAVEPETTFEWSTETQTRSEHPMESETTLGWSVKEETHSESAVESKTSFGWSTETESRSGYTVESESTFEWSAETKTHSEHVAEAETTVVHSTRSSYSLDQTPSHRQIEHRSDKC